MSIRQAFLTNTTKFLLTETFEKLTDSACE